MTKSYVLLSTVVAPSFEAKRIEIKRLSKDEFLRKLASVERNFCGHPVTMSVLRQQVSNIPDAQRGQFWDGEGIALAARPKGGVRGAKGSGVNGDTQVGIDDLEFCEFFVK